MTNDEIGELYQQSFKKLSLTCKYQHGHSPVLCYSGKKKDMAIVKLAHHFTQEREILARLVSMQALTDQLSQNESEVQVDS